MLRMRLSIMVLLSLLLCFGAAIAQTAENGLVVEVKNDAGRPLKNACVTVIPREGEITFRKADKEGRVRLKRMTPGNYRVVVKVDGYEAQKRVVSIGDNVETAAFSLQPRDLYKND